jgi:hypothetical protein
MRWVVYDFLYILYGKKEPTSRSPIHLLAHSGFTVALRRFIECSKIDINILDELKRTPLSHAAEQGM